MQAISTGKWPERQYLLSEAIPTLLAKAIITPARTQYSTRFAYLANFRYCQRSPKLKQAYPKPCKKQTRTFPSEASCGRSSSFSRGRTDLGSPS